MNSLPLKLQKFQNLAGLNFKGSPQERLCQNKATTKTSTRNKRRRLFLKGSIIFRKCLFQFFSALKIQGVYLEGGFSSCKVCQNEPRSSVVICFADFWAGRGGKGIGRFKHPNLPCRSATASLCTLKRGWEYIIWGCRCHPCTGTMWLYRWGAEERGFSTKAPLFCSRGFAQYHLKNTRDSPPCRLGLNLEQARRVLPSNLYAMPLQSRDNELNLSRASHEDGYKSSERQDSADERQMRRCATGGNKINT